MVDTRITNHRHYEEWYDCDRCGFQFPRGKMLVQNGRQLCTTCVDQPGYDAFKKQYPGGYEATPDPLPSVTEDL